MRARFPLPWRGYWGWVDAPSGAAAVNGGAATLLDQPVAAAPPGRLRAALERFGSEPLLGRGRGLGIDPGALRLRRVGGIVGFMRPVLLQAIFWNVWFNADLILLEHLRGPAETGTYAAAKAIALGFVLVPTAVDFVFTPRVARLREGEVRGHLLRVPALTAAVTLPLATGVIVVAGPLTSVLFGGRYAAAALPLVVLVAGMVPYGLKSVLGSLWLGLGHPVVETVSSGAAVAVTLATALWLIPEAGAVGAAAAWSAGAVTQLLVQGAVTM